MANVPIAEPRVGGGKAAPNAEGRFSKEELADLREIFQVFDINRDGSIETHEVGAILRAVLGHQFSEADLQKMVSKIDVNGEDAAQPLKHTACTLSCVPVVVVVRASDRNGAIQ